MSDIEFNNKKLATYYKGNEISNSFKSMIHVVTIYKVQLPDKVWSLIKEFMIYGKDDCKLVTKLWSTDRPYSVLKGKFVYFPYIFNLKRITKIIINGTLLTDIEVISDILKTNSTIKELNLNRNKIKDITSLGNVLKTNSTLTSLCLNENSITDINALADALNTNSRLLILKMDSNMLDEVDFSSLFQALAKNSTLTELSLRDNVIHDIENLSEALAFNTTLETLSLSDNEIIDITFLCEALAVNSTLLKLYLDHNDIYDIDFLSQVIEGSNNSLIYLTLNNTQIDDDDKDHLEEVWDCRCGPNDLGLKLYGYTPIDSD